jgi:Sulfotransferase domain
VQQAEIFDAYPGPVVDSRDLLENPEAMLRALCGALGIPFTAAMLSWPAGPRESDGVWGRYWYDSVWRSTGFGPYRPPAGPLPARLAPLAERCRPYYERLHARRLAAASQA